MDDQRVRGRQHRQLTQEVIPMNIQKITVRSFVTAVEAFLAAILATGLTDLTLEASETAALTALAAGLSVIYNALRTWLDSTEVG